LENLTKNLSFFTSIIEENLEYTLKLLVVIGEPAEKYKNENYTGKLKRLKEEIKKGFKGGRTEEIVRIVTYITILENIYN
jgi:hypothetical protein